MDATLPAEGSPYHELHHLLPKLAQPWWYKMVGADRRSDDQVSYDQLSPAGQKAYRRKAHRAEKRAERLKAARRAELAEKLGPLYILTA